MGNIYSLSVVMSIFCGKQVVYICSIVGLKWEATNIITYIGWWCFSLLGNLTTRNKIVFDNGHLKTFLWVVFRGIH